MPTTPTATPTTPTGAGRGRAPADVTGSEPRWLSPAEKQAWTGLVSLVLLLPGQLEAVLQRHSGLTLFEYLTLSHISEAPERRLRMSDLAYLANGSPTRLSNVMRRLEAQDLVTRWPDPTNRRYTIAALTDAGLAAVVRAAPAHVQSVRDLVLTRLAPAEQAALVTIAAKLGARVPETPTDGPPGDD